MKRMFVGFLTVGLLLLATSMVFAADPQPGVGPFSTSAPVVTTTTP